MAEVVLGISAFFHDSAAALLVDGELVAAAEEERFTRRKHDSRLPRRAIRFCLERGGLRGGDVDHVVFYERPELKLDRALMTIMAGAPRTFESFARYASQARSRREVAGELGEAVGVPAGRVLFVEHHLSHAASAFFASPFTESATLTVDGVGEWATASLGRAVADWTGGGNSLALTHVMEFPHSLGLLYSTFTEYLGFEVNDGEYKVMGLAAYGTPRYLDLLDSICTRYEDGSVWLDMRYFDFHRGRTGIGRRLVDRLGFPPRSADTGLDLRDGAPVDGLTRCYADLAASVQRFTELAVVAMARRALRLAGSDRLCLAGGVALNGVANTAVLLDSGASQVFIPPAPGDAGGAVGAALYAYHVLLGRPRRFVMDHAYWGAAHSAESAARALQEAGLPYRREPDAGALADRVAQMLTDGLVVGWFQDRFEWGPRALGNRSILADPRSASMKQTINAMVKFREPFRPFAPAVLDDDAPSCVAGPGAEQWPSRFMLLVLPLTEKFAAQAPAVNHFGTGRLQTVSATTNPLFHQVLTAFRERTGLGCVLNTSFNLRGEPIVGSPADAIATFTRGGLDALVVQDCVVSRR